MASSLSHDHHHHHQYLYSDYNIFPTSYSSDVGISEEYSTAMHADAGTGEVNNNVDLPNSNNMMMMMMDIINNGGGFNSNSSSSSSNVAFDQYSSDFSSSTTAALLGPEQHNPALHWGEYKYLWNNNNSYGPQKMKMSGHVYHEAGEECSSNFWPSPLYPTAGDLNWGKEREKEKEIHEGVVGMMDLEEPRLKIIARYSAEERKQRIIRYLKKRTQRNFNKTIKYACRKTLADKRVRVRGRFAKNNELSDDDHQARTSTTILNNHLFHDQQQPFFTANQDLSSVIQMEPTSESDQEEWLQEAIDSLMYYRS